MNTSLVLKGVGNFMSNLLPVALAVLALGLLPSLSHAADWVRTDGTGNWSQVSDGSTEGWFSSVPNAVGAVANGPTATGNVTVTQDIGTGVTIGTLSVGGSYNNTFQINLTNSITLNQDGAGAGFVTISNSASGTSSRLVLGGGSGTITLADDLLVTNTGSSTNAAGQGAITLNAAIGGSGNITFSNVSNDYNSGAIHVGQSASGFTGSVTVEKGAVTFSGGSGSVFGSNSVTLGSDGNDASLIGTNAARGLPGNNIVVAAGAGTRTLGNVATASANTPTFSGTILLNKDLTLVSNKPGDTATSDTRYTGVISGVGGLTIAGAGETQFGNGTDSLTHTYQGDTILTETSTLVLADNAALTFYIGASGVNNFITGTNDQILTLDGDFVFDLSGAAGVGSWSIVDVGNLAATFSGSFSVADFTQLGDVWTRDFAGSTYTFTESTGILTAVAVPEPSTYALLGAGLGGLWLLRRGKKSAA